MNFFFFFNDTATTEIYTLSLHDALPICELYCTGMSQPPKSTMRAPSSWCSLYSGVCRATVASPSQSKRAADDAKERVGPAMPAALLSCDLRDQAPERRSPSVGGLADRSTALQKPRGTCVSPSAVLVPERFRAEFAPSAFQLAPDSLRTDRIGRAP